MSITKTIKAIILAFILSMVILICFIATQKWLFWTVMNWIMEISGRSNYEGEDRGIEVMSILLEIIFPIIYIIILVLVYKWMSEKSNKPNAYLNDK